ncbi:MAG: NAD(P)H-dependent oxidoreductase [Oscillospiraceae bacterium]|nr:NAD(P)H-dependent oxidoreductase [Oscillospiraceae bacterium]
MNPVSCETCEKRTPERRVLFVNACVREGSRTLRLARRVLSHLEGAVTELDLEALELRPLSRETLARREALLAAGAPEDPLLAQARLFAAADEIVLAAPYWDLSFPASVKTWIEHVNCIGLSFAYGPDDRPYGLCRAKRLLYVMTAGGPILPPNDGYTYLKALCNTFYGIVETHCFAAEGLDLRAADPEAILAEAERRVDAFFEEETRQRRTPCAAPTTNP